MAAQSVLTDELRQAIGYTTEPVYIAIDKTLVARFADAVEDKNPLWTDAAQAAKGRFGTIIAPPSLLATGLLTGRGALDAISDKLPPRGLDGGGEWEFYQPIRVGDTVSVVSKLADIVERQGRVGTMLIVTSEITWRNQRQELVARALSQAIKY